MVWYLRAKSLTRAILRRNSQDSWGSSDGDQGVEGVTSENIIHLEDDFETSDRIYLVMEMMSGGELFDYVVAKGTLTKKRPVS